MFYLFWTLLNLVLFIAFIGCCYAAVILIRRQYNLFMALLFGLGLLGVFCVSLAHKQEDLATKKWQFGKAEKNLVNYSTVRLNDGLIYSIDLILGYTAPGKKGVQAIEAQTSETGVSGGYSWQPSTIILEQGRHTGEVRYRVSGTIEWSLLGIKILSQGKNYSGTISNLHQACAAGFSPEYLAAQHQN